MRVGDIGLDDHNIHAPIVHTQLVGKLSLLALKLHRDPIAAHKNTQQSNAHLEKTMNVTLVPILQVLRVLLSYGYNFYK